MPLVLALDAGTGGAKCAVIDERGRLRGAATQAWTYDVVVHPEISSVKEYSFDGDEFWRILCACAQRATAAVDAGDIIGVVTTSQREGCVFLGDDDRELYAGPNLDSRGFMEGLEVLEKLGASRLYEITGHCAPYIFPISRYLWFRKHHSEKVRHVLMLNDWMVWRCSGEMVGEPSNAAESMLFDFRERCWSGEILETFDIDPSILPRIAEPGEAIGAVGAEAARELGVAAGTPVYAGGADTQCGLLGIGAIADGDTGVTLGTTSPVQRALAQPVIDPQERLWAGCHVAAGRWVLESNAGSSGDAYEWLVGLLVGNGDERFDQAEDLIRGADRNPSIVAYLGPRMFDLGKMSPSLPGGVLFPFPAFQLRPNAGDLLQAFQANLAFAVRANIEQIDSVHPLETARILVGGGMSRSRSLCQHLADATGQPVGVSKVADATALGAAMVGFTGAGVYGDTASAVAAMAAHDTLEPNTADADMIEDGYRRWRRFYDTLDSLSL